MFSLAYILRRELVAEMTPFLALWSLVCFSLVPRSRGPFRFLKREEGKEWWCGFQASHVFRQVIVEVRKGFTGRFWILPVHLRVRIRLRVLSLGRRLSVQVADVNQWLRLVPGCE
ncbi:hypothetical protein IE53DRAFT_32133 [Violaceomyces palustris]|uniref:Uncharacterized protein n=1 Tax=Violaceomyces palustris TaxID=1673888 RepID=A0ACD0P7M3_9BASI|nr:hypothetical protein IE53DRAFT_32133 [Violaceomyces palustris]